MSLVTTATTLTILVLVAIILLGCVLPIVIIWLIIRSKTNETDKRTQIVLSALEKNPNLDVEELIKKMAPTQKKKLLKEKLLTRLLWGGIISLVGFSIIASVLWIDWKGGMDPEGLFMMYCIGGITFAVGIAFIINYFVGKKMLAKEIEAEEKQMTKQV